MAGHGIGEPDPQERPDPGERFHSIDLQILELRKDVDACATREWVGQKVKDLGTFATREWVWKNALWVVVVIVGLLGSLMKIFGK